MHIYSVYAVHSNSAAGSESQSQRSRSAGVGHPRRRSFAVLLQSSRVSLALGTVLTQSWLASLPQHRDVITRRAESTVLLVERLVAAFQQVQFRVAQRWVTVGMVRTVALPQETRPSNKSNIVI